MLSVEKITENWDQYLKYVTTLNIDEFTQFNEKYSNRIGSMPNTYKSGNPGCYAGGYIEHVILVTKLAFQQLNQFINYTQFNEDRVKQLKYNLLLSCLTHDLGKFGSYENESIIPNDNEWEKKNRGLIYKFNSELAFMRVQDRSIMLLNDLGIKLDYEQTVTIKLCNGLYDESNKPYLISGLPEARLRTPLPHILHQAKMLATQIETNNQFPELCYM